MPSPSSTKTVLIVGASRGLGYAMAEDYLKRGRRVAGRVRGDRRTQLHDLAAKSGARVRILSKAWVVSDDGVVKLDRHFVEAAGRRYWDRELRVRMLPSAPSD